MNSRRLLNSLARHAQHTWRRYDIAPRLTAALGLGLFFFLAQQLRCSFSQPPLPLTHATILSLYANNPYDQNLPDLQRHYLRWIHLERIDSLRQNLAQWPYEAGVIFHVFAEKSLLYRFLNHSDSSALYAKAATILADFFLSARADSFFIKRHELLQSLARARDGRLKQWVTANAAFISCVTLDTKDCEAKKNCFSFARLQFEALGDGKKVVDIMWLSHFFRDRQSEKAQILLANVWHWLRLSQKIGYRDGELEAYMAAAEKFGELGRFDSSFANYTRAEKLAERLGKTITMGNIIVARIEDAVQSGDLQWARAQAEQGLQLCRARKFRYVEADVLEKLASIHHLKQEYALALQYMNDAIALHREVAERIDLPPLFLQQAKIFFDLGDLGAALAAADSALQDYLALQDPSGIARTLGLMGLIHAHESNWRLAVACQERSLALIGSLDTMAATRDLWYNLGELRRKMGEYEKARDAYARAWQLSQALRSNLGRAKACLGLGQIALQKNELELARVYMEKALGFAQACDLREVLWHCHYGLARACERMGEYESAFAHYERALQELEAIRNTIDRLEFNMSYFSTVQEVFDHAIAFAFDALKDPMLALRYMEQSRARNLLTRMAMPGGSFTPQNALGLTQAGFEVKALQEILDDSTAVVEYRVTNTGCYLAFVTRAEVKVMRLSLARSEIENVVKNFRHTLGVDDPKIFKQRLRAEREALIMETERECVAVYQLLLAPIAEQLAALRRLYIVPDGPLFYLPFAALKRASGENFFLTAIDLAYAPSMSVLKILHDQTLPFEAEKLREALVLAIRSKTIPLAVDEAQEVAQRLPATQARVYDRLSSSEMRALLAQPHGIIHLALHADLNDKLPFYSYLLLDEGREKILNAAETTRAGRADPALVSAALKQSSVLLVNDLLDLNLRHCSLAVLSACNTALGKQISGEGMMGLTQGFLYAGASRLVTSLWGVDDRSAFDLMKGFYAELLDTKQAPASALRASQTNLMRDLEKSFLGYPFPYFWASFILTGAAN